MPLQLEAADEIVAPIAAPPPEPKRETVEAFADRKIPAFVADYQAEQSRVTDGKKWHREMWLSALKAIRGWPENKLVTEAEFDQALVDAQSIRIG